MSVSRLSFSSSGIGCVVVLLALLATSLNGRLVAPLEQLARAQAHLGRSHDRPTERRAATSPAALVISRATPHLAFAAALSHDVIVPGTRMSIVVDVSPKKGMHVYAPGTQYRPVVIAVQPDPLLRVHPPVYPKPTRYVFKPLNEEVLVYSAPFRVVLDITAGDAGVRQAELRTRSRLVIRGELEYQACDDTVCYLPTSIPFEWTVRVKR